VINNTRPVALDDGPSTGVPKKARSATATSGFRVMPRAKECSIMLNRLDRRHFLYMTGVTGVGLLAACAPAAAPAKPDAKPADAPKPAAPAAATAAPAAPAKPAEAAKPAAPAKPAAAAPAAKADAKPGNVLIGKLEGPEVITDASKWPKAFKEAPALAEMVKGGKLPAVDQRVPAEPIVVKPVHEIGKYGGTWRRGFTGPADQWNGFRAASGPDNMLFWDYTGDKIVPNVAKAWELQDGGRSTILHLRKGTKWSDGQPLTANDFVFWYEDVYLNKELFPIPTATFAINGKQGKVEKVDDLTVKFVFPEAFPFFPDIMAGSTAMSAHSYQGDPTGVGPCVPTHYMKQFHPKYASKADLDKRIADAKFDNWVLLFKNRNTWQLNPDLPVLTPWKTTTPANTPVWTLERNPYSMWVDTEGNQLPYIDKVVMTLAENLEVINLRAIAGEFDFQARHMDIGKLPVFIENQQKGNYKLYLDVADYGADFMIKFNLSYEADPEIGKWMANTDFRRALSLGIDRDQLNEAFWLGTGTSSSVVPADHNKYNPGPEWRKKWSVLDVKQANDLLDKVGLDKKDSEGYRVRTDGKGRLSLQITTLGGQFVQYTKISEAIRDQWKKIGIDLQVQETERSLAIRKAGANETQLYAWNNDGSEHLFTFPTHVFPLEASNASGPLYGQWFQSGGAQGKAPTGKLLELMEKFRKAFGVTEEERVKLGKEIWMIAADEVYNIGVVGLGAAAMGVRIAKNNMGNVPGRQYNSPDAKTPSISRPVTFYFKS
jgi:peptide/nickel transport system substrate-binding protein